MPVIAQVKIRVAFNDDGTVEILREKLNRCGCVDLVTESKKLDIPIENLRTTINSIDGIVCDDSGVCCATDVQSFAEKLKKFRED